MEYNIDVPSDWTKISEEDCKKYGIMNDEQIRCVGAYLCGEQEESYLIVFDDYSKNGEEFLYEIDKKLAKLDEMNKLVDGDPKAEGFEDTSLLRTIFHGFINKDKGTFYLNVNKMPFDNKYIYTFQMFAKGENGIFGAQSSMNKIDENDVAQSVQTIPHIKETIKVLISLANK